MLIGIVLLWILPVLSAPTWCYFLVWIGIIIKFIGFCKDLIKLGKDLK